jgi:hypothetical protein
LAFFKLGIFWKKTKVAHIFWLLFSEVYI